MDKKKKTRVVRPVIDTSSRCSRAGKKHRRAAGVGRQTREQHEGVFLRECPRRKRWRRNLPQNCHKAAELRYRTHRTLVQTWARWHRSDYTWYYTIHGVLPVSVILHRRVFTVLITPCAGQTAEPYTLYYMFCTSINTSLYCIFRVFHTIKYYTLRYRT